MKELFINEISSRTICFLNDNQRIKLKEILKDIFVNYQIIRISKMLEKIKVPINEITTEILRTYLSEYKSNSNAEMVTIDNIRRILSSFFTWLGTEDYITKSPIRRIHKVKSTRRVKEILTDENLEKLQD